jgi:hypothetical protein
VRKIKNACTIFIRKPEEGKLGIGGRMILGKKGKVHPFSGTEALYRLYGT